LRKTLLSGKRGRCSRTLAFNGRAERQRERERAERERESESGETEREREAAHQIPHLLGGEGGESEIIN